jgi:hypothetical protein
MDCCPVQFDSQKVPAGSVRVTVSLEIAWMTGLLVWMDALPFFDYLFQVCNEINLIFIERYTPVC